MKLKEYSVKRDTTKKKTIKHLDGSYATREEQYGVTLTFEFEEGEHLRDEAEVTKEANDKAKEALADLQDNDPDWIKNREVKKEKNDGYTTSK